MNGERLQSCVKIDCLSSHIGGSQCAGFPSITATLTRVLDGELRLAAAIDRFDDRRENAHLAPGLSYVISSASSRHI